MSTSADTLPCPICQGVCYDIGCEGDLDYWDADGCCFRYPPCEHCEGRGWIPRPPPGLFAQALTRVFTELLPDSEDPIATWSNWLNAQPEDCRRWMRDEDIPPADTLMRIITIVRDMRDPLADTIRANFLRVCNARVRAVTQHGSSRDTLGWYALHARRQTLESALRSLADVTEQEHVLSMAITQATERRDAAHSGAPQPEGGA